MTPDENPLPDLVGDALEHLPMEIIGGSEQVIDPANVGDKSWLDLLTEPTSDSNTHDIEER